MRYCCKNGKNVSKTEQDKNDIYQAIYDLVRAIPKGRVSSYGAIAAAVGLKSGARLVGYAMLLSGNVKPKVPAHRVVNSKGMLTGKHHFNPPEKMEQLLKKEKVAVKDDVVTDFARLFWDPLKEMEM